ncbi:hypothetical protein NL676_036254 [Syzygium grande]|nr:hypothetical protein NL676_036254 [Syzygium grande]
MNSARKWTMTVKRAGSGGLAGRRPAGRWGAMSRWRRGKTKTGEASGGEKTGEGEVVAASRGKRAGWLEGEAEGRGGWRAHGGGGAESSKQGTAPGREKQGEKGRHGHRVGNGRRLGGRDEGQGRAIGWRCRIAGRRRWRNTLPRLRAGPTSGDCGRRVATQLGWAIIK